LRFGVNLSENFSEDGIGLRGRIAMYFTPAKKCSNTEGYVSVDILRTITNNRKVGNAYERIPFPITIALPSSLQPRKGNYTNKAYQTEARCWRCYRRNVFAAPSVSIIVSVIVSTIAVSISTISISIASRIFTIENILREAGASASSVCKSGCRRRRCYCLSDVCD